MSTNSEETATYLRIIIIEKEGAPKFLRALKKSLKRKSLFLSASFKNGLFSAMSLISVAANAFLGASLEPLPSLRSVQGLKLLANPLEVVASTPINW